MTDAEYEQETARVRKLLDRWLPRLGLGKDFGWRIQVCFDRDGEGNLSQSVSLAAETRPTWTHMLARIDFMMPALLDQSDETVEDVVVHELCHVLVAEMSGKGNAAYDHEERVVTTLARAFLRTRDDVV